MGGSKARTSISPPTSKSTDTKSGIGDASYQKAKRQTDTSTYNNVSSSSMVGSIATLIPRNCYVVAVGPCAVGKTVSTKLMQPGH